MCGFESYRGRVTIIYALHEGDYKARYVGATTLTLNERLRLHKQKASNGSKTPVHSWIRERYGYVFAYMIETTDDIRAEEKWIAILDTHANGLNRTADGSGNLPPTPKVYLSDEEKSKRISEGRKRSNDSRSRCNVCGMESTTRNVSKHQNSSGHSGRTLIKPS